MLFDYLGIKNTTETEHIEFTVQSTSTESSAQSDINRDCLHVAKDASEILKESLSKITTY